MILRPLLHILAATALLLASGCAKAPTGLPADYPLTTCVISGEKLGSMGAPVKVSHDGTDVYLCCKGCRKDFEKEAAKHVQTVKTAAAAKNKS